MLNFGMVDIGCKGNPFTWSNGRNGYSQIQERLDKGVANGEWTSIFPNAVLQHLPQEASDHASIVLHTTEKLQGGPKPFQFENF